jgi:hypothetical protein
MMPTGSKSSISIRWYLISYSSLEQRSFVNALSLRDLKRQIPNGKINHLYSEGVIGEREPCGRWGHAEEGHAEEGHAEEEAMWSRGPCSDVGQFSFSSLIKASSHPSLVSLRSLCPLSFFSPASTVNCIHSSCPKTHGHHATVAVDRKGSVTFGRI